MATLENAAAIVSGIVIVAISALIFLSPPPDAFDSPIAPAVEPAIVIPDILPPIIPESEPIPDLSGKYPSSSIPLVKIFERVEASVVSVQVVLTEQSENMFGSGSGFVYDTKGHIITNAHVIINATKITVTFLDGRSYNTNVVGVDTYTDLAVIKTNLSAERLRPLTLADSTTLRVGEPVAAIGNPFGLSGSMTSGIISQLGRLLPTQGTDFSIPGIIQTDAPINPGNSGGPLLNSAGKVIGINTAIQSTTGQFTGIGFAVPSKTIQKVVPHLIAHGSYHHTWIGVSGIDIYPDLADALNLVDSRGFLVSEVVTDSPAERAGMRGTTHNMAINGAQVAVGGDIILAVDGIDVRKIDDILIHLQNTKSVGDMMDLTVLRDGEVYLVTLTLDERPRVN